MEDEKQKQDNAQQIIISYNEPQSPYYLNSSDHPSYIISPVILNGDNYGSWSRLVVNAPKSKNKLDFVNGKLVKLEDNAPEAHAWEKAISTVITWLYNVIDKNLHGSVAYADTARAIWVDLEERYSQGNSIRIHQLKREITPVSQGNLTMTEYFTKMKELWDELGTYQIMPRCTCNYKCGAAKGVTKIVEEEKVHQFHMGLNSTKYKLIRSNILSMEPLPTLNKAYAGISCEERQQQFSQDVEARPLMEASAFKVNATNLSLKLRQNGNRPRCSHSRNRVMRNTNVLNLLATHPIGRTKD